MAKFQKRINIYALSDAERSRLQVGQHIHAGSPDSRGVWCGMSKGGTSVVMWEGNAKGRNRQTYASNLRQYAQQ